MNWQTFGSRDQKPSLKTNAPFDCCSRLWRTAGPSAFDGHGFGVFERRSDLMKFPGMKTPYSSDKLIVSVTGANGLRTSSAGSKNSSNRDLQKAIDPTQTKIFWENPMAAP